MTGTSHLDRLAKAYGILPGYTDIWQRPHETGAETKRALLTAMGVPARSDAEIEQSLTAVDASRFRRLVPEVIVREEGETIVLPVALDAGAGGRLAWTLTTEDGAELQGHVRIGDLDILAQGVADGRARVRRRLRLPDDLPTGYHRCLLSAGDAIQSETEVIVTPKRAYQPDSLDRKGGLAGLMAPLYGLRSERNAGIGDFADLAELASIAASAGAGFVGINPVHALFPWTPERVSPYAPSSRRFTNVLMIALDKVPELELAPKAKAMMSRAGGDRLERCRRGDLVNYEAVSAFKLDLLEELFRVFCRQPLHSPRRVAFRAYRAAQGEALERHAEFEALSEHFLSKDGSLTDWHLWPERFHSPDSQAVRELAEHYADRVTFYVYLQWLADTQLEQAQAQALDAGMPIGLYLDLAVGVAADGAEAWSDRTSLVETVRLGAPPDDFNPAGQNWGLLPLSPLTLGARRYRPFIDLLRHTMRHAGMLRIDHVMGLARSFWVPEDEAISGGYVEYPLNDLLGLAALESQRQRCVVIGEDLGTVPKTLRATLSERGFLGCRLLYFERDEDDACRPAHAYPKHCIASIGTHDLATLAGFWEGRDIVWRERLGIYPNQDKSRSDREEREKLKAMLLRGLLAEGLLPDGIDPEQPPRALPECLLLAFHRFLGLTPALFKAVQLEDIIGTIEQANLPGTIDEHPNWRRKIGVSLEDLAAEHRLPLLLKAASSSAAADVATDRPKTN